MKNKERTEKEISKMIDKLEKQRETIPQFSYFGDDNWHAIDIQIDVLNGEITDEDQIYDQQDEGEITSYVVSSGIDALLWLSGDNDTLVED